VEGSILDLITQNAAKERDLRDSISEKVFVAKLRSYMSKNVAVNIPVDFSLQQGDHNFEPHFFQRCYPSDHAPSQHSV
jgi:hypothetical protein